MIESQRTSSNAGDVNDCRIRQNLSIDGPKLGGGHVLFGRGESGRHLTHYDIDSQRQLGQISDEVLSDGCLPLRHCPRERRCAAVVWLWSFVSSESFLYSLHVISIALGAFNSALELRKSYEVLSLAQSMLETAATLFLIVIRLANGYSGYKKVRGAVGLEQNFDADSDLHVRRLRRVFIFYFVSGVLLFGLALACFFVFYHLFHLGWTVLTNNFCLLTIIVLWDMYSTLVDITAVKMREDQFKVVIHEALDMIGSMSETLSVVSADHERGAQAARFVRIIKDSRLFATPDYVSLKFTADKGDIGVTPSQVCDERQAEIIETSM